MEKHESLFDKVMRQKKEREAKAKEAGTTKPEEKEIRFGDTLYQPELVRSNKDGSEKWEVIPCFVTRIHYSSEGGDPKFYTTRMMPGIGFKPIDRQKEILIENPMYKGEAEIVCGQLNKDLLSFKNR